MRYFKIYKISNHDQYFVQHSSDGLEGLNNYSYMWVNNHLIRSIYKLSNQRFKTIIKKYNIKKGIYTTGGRFNVYFETKGEAQLFIDDFLIPMEIAFSL